MAEWDAARQERLRVEEETRPERERKRAEDEQRYLKRLRDYHTREAAREKKWETLLAQHKDTYMSWAQNLLDLGLTPDDIQHIAITEWWIFLGELDWVRIRTIFGKLNPPYVKAVRRRKSLSSQLRREIYQQYQGKCYYCGSGVALKATPDETEYLNARRAFRAREREIRTTAEAAGYDWHLYNRLIDELMETQIGQRWKLNRSYKNTVRHAHIDHLLPVARGGSDDRDNLVLACLPCNLRKSMRTVEEFKAMPDDPISELRGYLREPTKFVDLTPVSALYHAEKGGYTALPRVDGYPVSFLGNLGLDGALATEDAEWRARTYQCWRDRLYHRGMPKPPNSLKNDYERVKQLQRIARQEI